MTLYYVEGAQSLFATLDEAQNWRSAQIWDGGIGMSPEPVALRGGERYVLNSAVITAYGRWEYLPCTPEQARAWLKAGRFISTIRYAETAAALAELTGIAEVAVANRTVTMDLDDEALVFRLVFPAGYRPDPAAKGRLGREFIAAHHELGLLRRMA